MEPIVLEWLNVVLRWAHVVAAIMWIGDSFLFMFLDRNLETPRKPREGDVMGELWLTHGGGFYELVKRKSLRPEELPPTLHWFKWESYSTWITGFFLITVVYYLGGEAMLVPPGGPLTHGQGVLLSIGLLAAGVGVYDLLCRTPLERHPQVFGLVGLALLCALTWGLSQVFTERAVFLQVGAMIATVMSSNVLLRIIPGQRKMLAATRAGTPVDTSLGARAKLRSTHNHYLTFPVLILMLSNHFPAVYGAKWPWLTLALIAVVGVGVKAFMNFRLKLHPVQLGGTAVALGALVFITLPSQAALPPLPEGASPVAYETVHQIIQTRCATCHAQKPSYPAFAAPPSGVVLETPEQVLAQKDRIIARTVHTRTMPLGNLTGMTEDERLAVAAWVAQGATIGPLANGVGKAVGGAVAPSPTPNAANAEPSAADAGAAHAGAAEEDPVQSLYLARCVICHGPKGAGDGAAAMGLEPKPRNFADPSWQASVTDEHLRKVIVGGGGAVGKSAAMPPNGDLEAQPEMLEGLVQFIRAMRR